jgi:hypothetical protein
MTERKEPQNDILLVCGPCVAVVKAEEENFGYHIPMRNHHTFLGE